MKLLHTSDWHIGRTLFQHSLIEDQRFFLKQFTDLAVKENVDAILISGDLYNRSIPGSDAVELLNDALTSLVFQYKIPVFAISGNHDSPERLSFCSRLMESSGLFLAGASETVIKKITRGEGKQAAAFWLLPYFTPQTIRRVLKDNDIQTFNDAFSAIMTKVRNEMDTDQVNVLLAHGFFRELGNKELADPVFSQSELSVGTSDIMDLGAAAGFDYIALGHLHSPQSAGNEKQLYSGSPLKYSVSEAGQKKSVFLIEIGENKEIFVSSRQFPPLHDLRIIRGAFDDLLEAGKKDCHSDDYIYAEITEDDAILYAASRLRAVYPNLLGLSFDLRQSDPYGSFIPSSNPDKRPVEELFEEFYRSVRNESLEGNRREIACAAARKMREENYETD